MVVVKQLDPNYPRMGYEVQKGLMIELPRGDGKAEITESDDGTLTLSESNGKYTASLKNVRLSEFGDHHIVVVVEGSPEGSHLVLEDLNIESPMATIRSFCGENRVSDTILMGANDISMAGHTIDDAYIDNSVIMTSSVEKDSLVERSRLLNSTVTNSDVVNSSLDSALVADSSRVELSYLMGDTVKQAKVGGVKSGWDIFEDTFDERTFEKGYFVGNGKSAEQDGFDHGYVDVSNEDDYAFGLATLAINRDLPFRPEKEGYYLPELTDDRQERLDKAWEKMSEAYQKEALELAPFLKEVVEPAPLTAVEIAQSFDEDDAWREADDFTIDESQFEVKSQQGLQQ
jgi:hypothetical protein